MEENIMEEKEFKEMFFNRAEVENAEQVVCDNCFEHMVFMLKDSQGREFSLGLSNVLECLSFAISEGNLPKLPVSWLSDVDHNYGTGYSENEDLFYSDNRIIEET